MKPNLLSGVPLLAVLVWVLALVIDPGVYTPGSVALIGVGWLLLATVATVGMVIVEARWARRTLVAVLATTLLVSLLRPLDPVAMAGLAATAAGLIVLLSPGVIPGRRLPSAAGPPEKAVVMILAGLSAPLALGLVPAEPALWTPWLAAIAPVSVFLYSRRVVGGLALTRYGLAAVTVAAAFLVPPPHAVVALLVAATVTVLAWTASVSVAFRPPVETGSAYPIPPELTPKEILEEARIDERGRPL